MRFTNPAKNLLIASNLWYLGEGLFGPLFAVYSEQIGGNILDITWAWAMYMVVTGFATIIVGKIALTERRQKWLAVLGYALNAVLSFCYLIVNSPMQLMLLQGLLGVAQAMATPTWFALYAQYGSKNSGEAWGQSQGQASIFTGLAFLVGGSVAAYLSFQTLFLIMGVVQVIATIAMFGILRPDEEPTEEAEASADEAVLTLDLA